MTIDETFKTSHRDAIKSKLNPHDVSKVSTNTKTVDF